MSVESPEYQVLRREGSLELRRYHPYLTASVNTRAASYNEATYTGFGLLAEYIFGNNTEAGSIAMTAPVTASRSSGTKIAMTAPVTSERARSEQLETAAPLCTVHCAGEYIVRFTMPSRFGSLDDLPRPNDPRVVLDAVPAHLAAVAGFGGRLSESPVAEAVVQLSEWIEREGLVASGEPEVAQYDAPWMPGFARRNEVLIPVEDLR
ncbi:MAG: heme-binding protein [Actinomycetota bacterium]|nr:heme-binding protein [Actinomycetota bacterium]MDZ4178162.1 heme-binding protein [Coriobacteriia bacterium]